MFRVPDHKKPTTFAVYLTPRQIDILLRVLSETMGFAEALNEADDRIDLKRRLRNVAAGIKNRESKNVTIK